VTLKSLAIKYACDKYYAHSYIPLYEELFRGRTVKRLLEIGIGYEDLMKPFVPKYIHGASLRMWADYWPEAEIFACDIREDTLINEGRIHSMVCDQSSLTSTYAMTKAFDSGHWDVIIDDGSHNTEDQYRTAATLLVEPYLNKGGVYIIEDVREPDELFFRFLPIVRRWQINPESEPLQVHLFNKRPDDCLIVIQK